MRWDKPSTGADKPGEGTSPPPPRFDIPRFPVPRETVTSERSEGADTVADKNAKRIEQLEGTLGEVRADRRRLLDVVSAHEATISDQRSTLGRQERMLEHLESWVDDMEADNSRLTDENSEIRAENSQLKAENREIRAENERLKAELAEARETRSSDGAPLDSDEAADDDGGDADEPADTVGVSDNDEGMSLGKLDFPEGRRPGSPDTYGRPLDRPDGTRIPLFDGDPARDQVQQGRLGDCGVIAAIGAVAGHNPPAIKDRIRETTDGNYEVRLHEAAYDSDSHYWKPTGREITLEVTPDLPVSSRRPDHPGFAGSGDAGVAWPSIMEKALAGVDRTWTEDRRADWEQRWPRQCAEEEREVTPAPKEYERLNEGTTGGDWAEILTQLTGRTAMTRALPTDLKTGDDTAISGDVLLTERFRGLLRSDRPVLVGTRQKAPDEIELPYELEGNHAYEVVGIDDDSRILLRNPWNHSHPEPMTAQQFRENIAPFYTTLEKK